MPVDTSIYNALLRPAKSIAEYDAEAMQGQQNKLALQMNRAKMDEYTRGVERSNKLASMLGGFQPGMSAADQGEALTRGGFIDEGRKVIESGAKVNKDQREGEKAQRDAEKAQLEGHFKKFELAGQIMSTVRDQASWDAARQQTAQVFGPEAAAQMPAEYNPQLVEQKRMQALSVQQQLEQTWKERGYDLEVQKFGETVRSNKVQERTSAGNLAVAQGNLKVSRARLATERAAPKGQIVQTEDGPVLVDPRTGQSIPVLGTDGKPVGKTKAPTEFQGKSAAFGARADQADKIISSLQGKYSPAAINTKQGLEDVWLVGGALASGANKLLGADAQRAEQAQRDFINAVLRQESGAAIGASEFDNAKKQYFPQPGDKPEVLKQKAENRRLAVKGFQTNAGRAAFSTDAQAPTAATALPSGWSVEVK